MPSTRVTGFLSENGDFAEAVINAGLTWIGPSPQSIRDLGDKVTARHIALRAEAPMAPARKNPSKTPTRSSPSLSSMGCRSPLKPPSVAADAA